MKTMMAPRGLVMGVTMTVMASSKNIHKKRSLKTGVMAVTAFIIGVMEGIAASSQKENKGTQIILPVVFLRKTML